MRVLLQYSARARTPRFVSCAEDNESRILPARTMNVVNKSVSYSQQWHSSGLVYTINTTPIGSAMNVSMERPIPVINRDRHVTTAVHAACEDEFPENIVTGVVVSKV